MFITKQNLIDIGIREDKIIVFNVPICTLNKKIMCAKVYKFNSLDDVKNVDFIKNIIGGSGFIFMCYNNHNEETDNEFVLRIYEDAPTDTMEMA